MSVELAGLASSFTALNTLTKTMIGLHDAAKLNAKVVEFQHAMIEANSHVIAVQQEYSSLTAQVHELEKENVRLKDWAAEKEKYTLRQIADGVFAYTEKQEMGNFENAKKLCCNCFEDGRKSFLQQTNSIGKRGTCILLKCSKCNATLEFFGYTRTIAVN